MRLVKQDTFISFLANQLGYHSVLQNVFMFSYIIYKHIADENIFLIWSKTMKQAYMYYIHVVLR